MRQPPPWATAILPVRLRSTASNAILIATPWSSVESQSMPQQALDDGQGVVATDASVNFGTDAESTPMSHLARGAAQILLGSFFADAKGELSRRWSALAHSAVAPTLVFRRCTGLRSNFRKHRQCSCTALFQSCEVTDRKIKRHGARLWVDQAFPGMPLRLAASSQ